MTTRRDCQVLIPDPCRFGEFANAFRVLPDADNECLLDFMVYSATENVAKVVARVRVRRDFLPDIRTRIKESMIELGGAEAPIEVQVTPRRA